jgi:orotate phosphoribosyltransferase
MMDAEKERLRQILLIKSYEKRPVTLASGKSSDFYIDCRQTTLDSEGIVLVGLTLWDLLQSSGRRIDAFGGPTLGADPIVSAVSVVSTLKGKPRPAFLVRKEPKNHGTQAWIEGDKSLGPGMQVALLEDVITTGDSLLQAANRVEAAGLNVSVVCALVDREEGGADRIRERGYRFLSLFTKTELLQAPAS